jgi:hypothetical protein
MKNGEREIADAAHPLAVKNEEESADRALPLPALAGRGRGEGQLSRDRI